MKILTLYTFDPKTRRPNGKKEVQLKDEFDPFSLPAEDLWAFVGLDLPCLGTIWPPPEEKCIHDGTGWFPYRAMTVNTVIGLLEQGVIDAEHALKFSSAEILSKAIEAEAHLCIRKTGHAVEDAYTRSERETWPQQLMEAQMVEANPKLDGLTPMLSAIAKAEGRGVAELAESIIKKSEEYNVLKTEYLVSTNGNRKRMSELRSTLTADTAVQIISQQVEALKSARDLMHRTSKKRK